MLAALYKLTMSTGSLRYMAPEIAMEQPYNESCDVYSWGILYWQVCSLQTPYSRYTTRQHAERVVRGGERPKPDKSWPKPWKELMTECWAGVAGLRPTMEHVLEQVTTFDRSLAADDDEEDVVHGDVETGVGTLALAESTDTARIKAKKKKKAIVDGILDVDTRLGGHTGPNKRNGSDLV